jgi:hypothetical protein
MMARTRTIWQWCPGGMGMPYDPPLEVWQPFYATGRRQGWHWRLRACPVCGRAIRTGRTGWTVRHLPLLPLAAPTSQPSHALHAHNRLGASSTHDQSTQAFAS